MRGVGDALRTSPCLAIDIGASKVDVGVVLPDGSIVARGRLNVAQSLATLFEDIVRLAREVRGDATVEAVGVGSAGPMSRGGETVSPLNIASWRDFPLRSSLRDALELDVYIDGDARALALAEGVFGAARESSSYLSMVVSTGVGGGIVLDGRLLDGETGNSGHVGHLNVVPDGALCACGAYGCLEAEVSGRAIEERTGRPASEADQATRQRTGQLVGRAVGSLASVLDFRHCYVAGSVALGYGDEFFHEATKAARTVAMLSYSHEVDIRRSHLGGDGPILGAAVVAWRGAP
ncbi:MAG: ROK family protein [Acidimicrobiales bacterium]